MTRQRGKVGVEIAWRWFFVLFAVCVVAGVAFVAQDAVRLRPNEAAALRSRNPAWILMALMSVIRRYPTAIESGGRVVLVTLGGFWVLAGAALRAMLLARRFWEVVVLRAVSLATGSLALVFCWTLIMTVVARRLPPALAMAVVSLFSSLSAS